MRWCRLSTLRLRTVSIPPKKAGPVFAGKPIVLSTRAWEILPPISWKTDCFPEEGEGAVAFASGMGAISAVFYTLLANGDHIVADKTIYGCTFAL